jgi:hypothetical protein
MHHRFISRFVQLVIFVALCFGVVIVSLPSATFADDNLYIGSRNWVNGGELWRSSQQKPAYLPIVLNNYTGLSPQTDDIYGRVTENGNPVANEEIMLRFDNGSSDAHYATSSTGSNGEYRFTNLPVLASNETFYVRWFNDDNNDGRLSTWACWAIAATTTASDAYRCDFDLTNVELQSPEDTVLATLPAKFSWQRRYLTTDDYEFNLADMDDYDPHWWSNPSSGYSDSYTLNGLPFGFSPGKQYGWWPWVFGPDGYGLPYYYRYVTFSHSGMTLIGEEASLASSSRKSAAEVIAPPRPQSFNK